jgi:pimeloyl-ACP methyl ester carboxylesterase
MRRALLAASLWAATGLAPAAKEVEPPLVTDPIYAAPVRLVEVESGRRLNLYCIGNGSPTIVFESGAGGGTVSWAAVQATVARNNRACSYDRAGTYFSDFSLRPGTSHNFVEDLHQLLAAAGEKAPFVLVGHSFGGMLVRLYADTYRSEVAGLVLVDPMHEDQSEAYRALDPAKASAEAWAKQREPGYAHLRRCAMAAVAGFRPGSAEAGECGIGKSNDLFGPEINQAYALRKLKPEYWQGQLSESINLFHASSDQVRASRRVYGALPLVVLTRSPAPKRDSESQAERDRRNATWLHLHDDIASLSSIGKHRVVDGTGHAIQFDQPAAVLDAIREVIGTATASEEVSRTR